ncbi:MAG: HAD-IA family hydrolase [Candidatus Micrarchaeia archaeon]|jgi:HAD superfamily hydrolase (TIGR01549 family)
MAIKAIIFDIDGVLADSREAISHNTKCLMREFGFDVPDARIDSMSSAHSAESVLIALAPSLSADRAKLAAMLDRLRELTNENMALVKPSMLAAQVPALAARYRLAAASNRKSSAIAVLRQIGIEKYFEAVMTSGDAPVKPDPTMIRLALARLGVRADKAVFVGDNLEDMQAGEGAGVRSIMLDGMNEKACAAFVKEFLG